MSGLSLLEQFITFSEEQCFVSCAVWFAGETLFMTS